MNAFAWRLRRSWRIVSSLAVAWSLLGISNLRAADVAGVAADKRADADVREALQREVYGLDTDRQQLLSSAISAAPNNAAARWHQGYVRSADGNWVKADQRADERRQALLAQYDNLRATHADTAVDQFALADWCLQRGLKDQERAHLLRVCELAPDHAVARQRLDFVRVGQEWVTRTELARQKERAQVAERALVYWTPIINKLLPMLTAREQYKRRLGTEQVLQIHDPAALPALQTLVATRGEEMELLVIEATSRMTDPTATAALARHAVFSPSLKARQVASAKLQGCDHDCFVPLLCSAMYTPITSRMAAVSLPNGTIGYRHEFLREGSERQELLVLDTEYSRVARFGGNRASTAQAAFNDAALTARQLEAAAARQNQDTIALNDRIGWVLSEATGAKLPAVPDEWWSWWNDQNEVFVEGAKPVATIQRTRSVSIVDRDFSPSRPEFDGNGSPRTSGSRTRRDCLAAGTPVWTERGQVAIEKVLVGDLVLSRDVESGELAFKPVLRTTIRPASLLVKIDAGGETFETSGGHLFWVSGEGWVRSRNLQSGQVLHTAQGPARVMRVAEGKNAMTYNLVVADFNTYFVGQQKLLSHDNTVRRPTTLVVPGLKAE